MATEDRLIELFDGFVASGNQPPIVESVYNVLPWLSPSQQRAFLRVRHLADRYGFASLRSQLDKFEAVQRSNRVTGFSFSKIVQAVSLHQFMKEMAAPPQSSGVLRK